MAATDLDPEVQSLLPKDLEDSSSQSGAPGSPGYSRKCRPYSVAAFSLWLLAIGLTVLWPHFGSLRRTWPHSSRSSAETSAAKWLVDVDRLTPAPGCKTSVPGEACFESIQIARWAKYSNPDWYDNLSVNDTLWTWQMTFAAYGWNDAVCAFPPCCRTASPGDPCYHHIVWAKTQGVILRPDKFPGLTTLSSFHDFQLFFFQQSAEEDALCPVPPCSECEVDGQPGAEYSHYWETKCYLGMPGCLADDKNLECRRCRMEQAAPQLGALSAWGSMPGDVICPPKEEPKYSPANPALLVNSSAPLFSFYMYRAESEDDSPEDNINTANLAGVIWYLHHEIVPDNPPRRFNITRIIRYKVQTRAPEPLFKKGMNFGVRYAFDYGMCDGPWDCSVAFEKMGYFVGCNNVSQFPTEQFSKRNHYTNAIWYSLPGKCPEYAFPLHSGLCAKAHPGGRCSGSVTGTGDCTYSIEKDGEIRVDELEGIEDYNSFIQSGGLEYNWTTDRGVGMSFWDGMFNKTLCDKRVAAAKELFQLKFGDEGLDEPPCDFNREVFYKDVPLH